MGKLEGKVAIVSGASSGLGFADAQVMAREGAKVVMFARNEENILAAGQKLLDEGLDVLALSADATIDDDWQRVLSATLAKYGQLDVLVNNAGNTTTRPFEEWNWLASGKLCREGWDECIEAIFWSQVKGIEACLPELRKTRGVIINNSSMTAVRTNPPISAYACANAAMRVFSKTLAAQLGPEGIRVNCVIPGWINSNLFPVDYLPEEVKAPLLSQVKLDGRFGCAEEIGKVVAFLASDEASYVTGEEIVVDGGFQL